MLIIITACKALSPFWAGTTKVRFLGIWVSVWVGGSVADVKQPQAVLPTKQSHSDLVTLPGLFLDLFVMTLQTSCGAERVNNNIFIVFFFLHHSYYKLVIKMQRNRRIRGNVKARSGISKRGRNTWSAKNSKPLIFMSLLTLFSIFSLYFVPLHSLNVDDPQFP